MYLICNLCPNPCAFSTALCHCLFCYLRLSLASLCIFSRTNQRPTNALCALSSEFSTQLLHSLPLCLLLERAVTKYCHTYFHMSLHRKCLLLICVKLRKVSFSLCCFCFVKAGSTMISINPTELHISHKVCYGFKWRVTRSGEIQS